MTHDLPAVSRVNPGIDQGITPSDLLISGGGSLLQDITGPFSSLLSWHCVSGPVIGNSGYSMPRVGP